MEAALEKDHTGVLPDEGDLMSQGEQDYLQQRARQERARAARCHDHGVARIHHLLAEEYDRRALGVLARAQMASARER